MKKYFLTLILLSASFNFVAAQESKPTPNVPKASGGDRSHTGFHFEFGLGPAFGTINDSYFEASGPGTAIELKFGGAVSENLILTFDMLNKVMNAPKLTAFGYTVATPTNVSLSEVTYGAGLTYYLMPSDFFGALTLGGGTFVVDDTQKATRSKFGFSSQIKVGKHWWISKKWGVSIGAAYATTHADNTQSVGYATYVEKISSQRYTIIATIGVR